VSKEYKGRKYPVKSGQKERPRMPQLKAQEGLVKNQPGKTAGQKHQALTHKNHT
jgi:hypothetical protein